MSLNPSIEPRTSTPPQLQLVEETQLAALVSTYLNLKSDLELVQAQMDREKALIGSILDAEGIDKLKISDCALTWVRGGTTSTLDKKKLLAQGVTLAMLDAATVTKPKRDYFQIRGKGEVVADE